MSKNKLKKLTAIALSAIGVSTLSAGVAGCVRKSVDMSVPENVEMGRLTPPDDGSLPTAHTCAENLAYIVSVFDSQTQYHSYSYGVTSASIATQTTRTFRDFKDGVLMTTDLTYSSMVKSGTQTCMVYDDEGVPQIYFRTSEAPEADTLPSQAVWSEEDPLYFSEKAYNFTYGLLPNELFNYIVNEDNIIESEQVTVNPDGTYTQNFTLDPVASTYYYRFGMKTRGGLSGFPEFVNITFSVTFDGDWRILSANMHEVANVNKGIVVSSVSDFATEYWYGDEKFDDAHYAYYDSYYKQYLGDTTLEEGGSADENMVIDVPNVLSNGFSQIMNGGAQYEITMRLGENVYTGYVYLSLDLADPLETLALKLSLGKSLKEQTLYLEYANKEMTAYYGKDFALQANLAEVKLAVEQFAGVIDGIAGKFAKPEETAPVQPEAQPEAEGTDPLTALMDSMTLVAGDKQAELSLNTGDLLGMGIGINAKLVFGINESAITFRGGTIGGLSIGGNNVDLGVVLRSTTAPQIGRDPSQTSADLAEYVSDVHSLLASDLIKVDLQLDGNGDKVSVDALRGLRANVAAYVDLDGVTVGADADVGYMLDGKEISAKLSVWYNYDGEDYGTAALRLTEIMGAPVDVKVKCDVKQIADAISTVIQFGATETGIDSSALVGKLSHALAVDFTPLLTEMYADKAQIRIGVDIDTVLEMLDVNTGIEFGSCNLVYARGEGDNGGQLTAALPALGFRLGVSGADGEAEKPDLENYLDLKYVLDDINALLDADLIKASIALDGTSETVALEEIKNLKSNLGVYLDKSKLSFKKGAPLALAAAIEADVSYIYNEREISAKLTAWYDYDGAKECEGENYGSVILRLDEIMGAPVSVCVRADIANLLGGIKTLLNTVGVEMPKLELGKGGVDANLSGVLDKVLKADISKLLPVLETDGDGLKLTADVDGIVDLFGVDLGLSLGNVSLAYSHKNLNLTAQLPALGLGVELGGTDALPVKPDDDSCLDLTYAVDDINALLGADLIKASIALDGSAETVTFDKINGLAANVDVYFDYRETAVAADVALSYTYKDATAADGTVVDRVVSLALSVWYGKDESGNDRLAILLNNINGVNLSAKVYCDFNEISTAVGTLLEYAAVQMPEGGLGGLLPDMGNIELDNVLSDILSADFNELLPTFATTSDGFTVAANADKVLEILDIDLGLTFGNVNLAYSHKDANLTASLPNLGLSVAVCGANEKKDFPDVSGYFDVAKLVETVNNAWELVNGIKAGEALSFDIADNDTYIYLDGIRVKVWGSGEVSWKKGNEYVALDLSTSIAEEIPGEEVKPDITSIKLYYDKNATDTPLITLALNDIGLEIYKEDIDLVKNGFTNIYNKVMSVLGKNEGSSAPDGGTDKTNQSDATGAAPISGETSVGGETSDKNGGNVLKEALSNDTLMSLIFKVLSSGKWVEVLDNLTLSTDGNSLAVGYLKDNAVNIGVDGGDLVLNYVIKPEAAFSLGGNMRVGAVDGSIIHDLQQKFEDCTMSSSKRDGNTKFTRLAYDFLFKCISNIKVENILGADTYTVSFMLNGNNTNIPELKDILIDVDFYVTGELGEQGKMAEADINIDAAGVVIDLNVIIERKGNSTHFYMLLNKVMDVILPDLKFSATQESLYDTIDVLISTINSTNVLDAVKALMPKSTEPDKTEPTTEPDKTEKTGTGETPVIEKSKVDKLADILSKILNFNFSDAIVATSETGNIQVDGVIDANIDLDNIMRQLDITTGELGTVNVHINRNDHSMTTSGKTWITDYNNVTELKEWISLSSQLAPRRSYENFSSKDYISIEFLPTLIDDLVNTLTYQDGDTRKLLNKITLSGSISANIVSIFKVNLNPVTATVAIDEKEGLSVSLVAHINSVTALIVNIPESTFGLTYKNGLLTLARGLDTKTPEYRIMTFDYFIDHMMVKQNSTLGWLLGMGSNDWKTLVGIVEKAVGKPIEINSGLTNTQDVYLYNAKEVKEDYEVSMYDYVNALRVILGGNKTADFGNISNLESKLGVTDNYYGFELNAARLTGGAVTELYAALTHGAEGLDAIKAYGAVQSYVTFSANLGFKRFGDNTYETGNKLTADVNAPDFYSKAIAIADDIKAVYNFEHFEKHPKDGYDEKFGSLNITSADNGYTSSVEYSHMLYSHVLTIEYSDGTVEKRDVRHGSTVYLYDNYSPIYADKEKKVRLIYSTDRNKISAASFKMEGDKTVYALNRNEVTVLVVNGSTETPVSSFVDDKVPTSIKGLETVVTPKYPNGTEVGNEDIITEVTRADGSVYLQIVRDGKAIYTLDDGQYVLRISGTFAASEVVIDCVKYKFTYDMQKGEGYYTAVGKGSSKLENGNTIGFNEKYSTNGETLVLASEIGGYPVTAIGDGAFANEIAGDGTSYPIRNVVVPSSIKTVGKHAFLNNIEMQSIIFLADTVNFIGSDGKDEGTYAFYGCSTSGNSEKTNLQIYYNKATQNGVEGNRWSHFSTKSVGSALIYYKYVGVDPQSGGFLDNGGGALHSGGWTYLTVQVNGADAVEELNAAEAVNALVSGGLITSVYTQANADELAANLNGQLAQYKNEVGGSKYIVTATAVNAGVSEVVLNVRFTLNVPKSVNLASQKAFGYPVAVNGAEQQYTGGGSAQSLLTAEEDGKLVLFAPKATDGSVFLGWATQIDGKLQFVGEKVEATDGAVFHAIWGISQEAFALKNANTCGSALADNNVSMGKWYDVDGNAITEISLDHTVLYTAKKINITVCLKGNKYNNFYRDGSKIVTAKSECTDVVQIYNDTPIDVKFENGGKTLNINGVKYTANKTGAAGVTNSGDRTFKYNGSQSNFQIGTKVDYRIEFAF